MNNVELIHQSRLLLKQGAMNVIEKQGDFYQKDPLNSYIPEQLSFAYKIMGKWDKSREMLKLSQEIEEKLKGGLSDPVETRSPVVIRTENLDHPLLFHGFLDGVFSGLIHPIAFCHHVEKLRDVLKEPKFADRFVNILGRFCGGVPSACGLVYSMTRFYDEPRIFLPIGLSLIATNSASAYRLLCKEITFDFKDIDDDSLVGFYKAFKGDLGGAYRIFEKRNDRIRLCMIGDFYLDEAEAETRQLKRRGLLNAPIMGLLMKKSVDIYMKLLDPTNIRRIAIDCSNQGFEDLANEILGKYYEVKNEKVKRDGEKTKENIFFERIKSIYHLSPEIKGILIEECEKMCRKRYKDCSVSISYTPRKELRLYEALSLMNSWNGEKDISYFMLKSQIYRLLGFRRDAERCESAVKSIELNRITIEEKAKTLKKFQKLHVHANPLARLKSMKSMEIRGYLSEEAIDFLNR